MRRLPSDLDTGMLLLPAPPREACAVYAPIEELADDELAAAADHLVTAA